MGQKHDTRTFWHLVNAGVLNLFKMRTRSLFEIQFFE